MPFLLRVELVDDERGNRVEGFEIRFDSQQMAYGLLTMVKKNAAHAGRQVAELGAPVDTAKVRTRLLDRLGKRPETQGPGMPHAPAASPGAPSGSPPGEAPAPRRSALWLKK